MKADVLFCWIPKTAGTSIDRSMRHRWGSQRYGQLEYGGKPIVDFNNRGMACFGHYSVESLVRNGTVSQDYLDRAYVFAFVRNPWARIASLAGHKFRRWKQKGHIRKYHDAIAEICDSLEVRWPNRIGLYNASHGSTLQPQSRWIFGRDGRQIVPNVFQFECLEQDWRTVCEAVGRDHFELPTLLRTSHPHHTECLTTRQARIIGHWYSEDIDRWNYQFRDRDA